MKRKGPSLFLVLLICSMQYACHACEFIGCGPYTSTKTVVVKDTMSVNTVDRTLCAGATGHYGTYHGNTVTWAVYSQDNTLLYTAAGVSLDYTFTTAGSYRVTASGSLYCAGAECWVSVLAGPPALTATSGPHEACTGSSILLAGTPTHPSFYLEWEPVCATATPSSVDGDEVTISYGNDVCNVAVYQVDGENGCRSAAYVHAVAPFVLAPSGLPSSLALCAGESHNIVVPLQDNVLYEWTVSPAGVAVVQSDHLSNDVTLLASHLTSHQPATAVVTLKRICCSGLEYVETFVLTTMDAPAPTVSCSTPVCLGSSASFAVTSTVTNPSDYTWHVGGGTVVGSTAAHLFTQSGTHPFTLSYQPFPQCPAVEVHGTVEVVEPPVAAPYFDGQDVGVVAYPNATYSWSKDGVAQPQVQGSVYPSATAGVYCCTVTYTTAPYCSASGCVSVAGGSSSSCITMPCTAMVNCTTANVSLTNTTGGTVSWSVSPQIPGNGFDYQDDYSASLVFSYPGVYTVVAGTTVGGQCHHGETLVTIECVPDFSILYMCDNPAGFVDRTLCLAGVTVTSRKLEVLETNYVDNSFNGVSIPFAAFQEGVTNHVVYTVTLSNGHQCQATRTLAIDYLPHITSLNVPAQMCQKTPYLFSANATGSVFRWQFGDGTYQYGNSIYHAFNNSSYATLTVSNVDGCATSQSVAVNIIINQLNDVMLSSIGSPVCPGSIRQIHITPNHPLCTYYWEYSPIGVTSSFYNTYQTGDYYVFVTNTAGCKVERITNVGFLNAPTASITGSTEYCFGEEVRLNGNTGSSNQYAWSVTGPASYTFSTPNISFTPTLAGVYQATLTVTNQTDGCSTTATATVTVHPQPAPPSIAFYNNECIHTPPVNVHSTANQSLLWSNGYHGVSADYYVPGFLSAYYLDPLSGCPSERKYLFIPPAPNFGALLTGCYEICDEDLPAVLPVYNLYPYDSDDLLWYWLEDDIPIDQGTTTYANLPVNVWGEYVLRAQYGNGCEAISPALDIAQLDVCPCDNVEVSVDKKCLENNCTLLYSMTVTIHNNSSQAMVFDQLSFHNASNVLSVNTLPVTVPANGSNAITVSLEFLDFANPYIEFTLVSDLDDCELVFSEYFDWQDCHLDDCYAVQEDATFLSALSTLLQTSYFNVYLELPSNTLDILTMWSDPPQLLSYNYQPYTDVDALLMLGHGRLTQMAMAGEEICIHAILCLDGEKLCHLQDCLYASDYLYVIPEDFRQLSDSSTADNDTTRSLQADTPPSGKLWLAPNPADGEVTVMGVAPGEVAEIAVLTMQGARVADYRNDCRFNIGRLAKASYIVRVTTSDHQVHYLKLVKQ